MKIIKEALLNFEYPPEGIRNMDVADALVEQFNLDDKTANAKAEGGYKIFLNYVNTAIRVQVNSGKLMRLRRGWIINPNQPEEIAPGEEIPSPLVIMERNYQEFQSNLETELLQKIKDHSPDFFEELVLDLLVEMGYGGSLADAQAVGGIGDGGIDGIIKQDPLGLDRVYVQAKRWDQGNVGVNVVAGFAGAIANKGARKGIMITTSEFTNDAKKFDAQNIDIILIDGEQLVQLMIQHNVGVSLERNYEIKLIDDEYFGEIEE